MTNTEKRESVLKLPRLGRWVSGAVGIVLAAAGLIKATNLELFMVQIKAYGLIDGHYLLLASAWGLVAVQCGLGTALILAHRPRVSLPATALLWLVLLGGTGWAAWTGSTDACGCFGAFLEHSPALATVENLLFLAATLYALWALGAPPAPPQRPLKAWAVAMACAAGVLLPPVFGVPLSATVQAPVESGKPGWLDALEVHEASLPDAGRGPLLVVLMGTDCAHCLDALPDLDDLAEEGPLPLLALCADGEAERKRFVDQFQPSFPLGRIDQDRFWKLLSTGDLPRLLLIRHGKVLHTWDAVVPDPDEVRERLPDEPA